MKNNFLLLCVWMLLGQYAHAEKYAVVIGIGAAIDIGVAHAGTSLYHRDGRLFDGGEMAGHVFGKAVAGVAGTGMPSYSDLPTVSIIGGWPATNYGPDRGAICEGVYVPSQQSRQVLAHESLQLLGDL